jgi:riboflavin biosynthesis pyrimidine reductase
MLWPTGHVEGGAPPGDVDPADIYGTDIRRPPDDRPWVLLNMIASVDGAATDPTGRSAGLGGPADQRVFAAIRGVADIVLAGASTVRTERYGPARTPPSLQAARRARGQSARPRIAVVTRSLALDLELPLFREASDEDRPIVITTTAGLERVRSTGGSTTARDLAMVAELVIAGDESVDWPTALGALRTTARAGVVLVEGGPNTNGQLVAADLVDELCLTVSPRLAGGDGLPIVAGAGPASVRHLFLRYLRVPDGA